MDLLQEIRLQLWAFWGLALGCGLVTLGLWLFRGRHRSLFPPQRYRAVPWSGLEIGMVLFLAFLAIPYLVLQVLLRVHFFTWFYGPDFPLPDLTREADPNSLVSTRLEIWALLFAMPIQVAGIPFLLYLGSGTRPYQLGLTTHRLIENVAAGYLGWFVLTPVVLGLHALVEWCYLSWIGARPQSHPFTNLATHQPDMAELVVLTLVAVVAAPVFEELIFRRLLQNWLAARPWGGQFAVAAAMAVAYLYRSERSGFWPMVFVLTMVPGFVYVSLTTWRWLPHPDATRAIYGTALLFAMFHTSVWPTPIPLFVLGLGLGYLAYRTQSLIGPVVLHALFNAVSSVTFFYVPPEPPPPPKGNETTSAVQRLSSASTVTDVPGSWLPRRTYPSAMAVPSRGDRTDEVTYPTSAPSRNTLAPRGTALSLANFSPTSDRLT
jgi:membrane protease YdiL (CAAX protease family)